MATREQLRLDLTAAVKARESATVRVLRTAIAAIDNAEAPPVEESRGGLDEHVAGASVGVGSSDVDRLELTDSDVRDVLAAERDERLDAARTYDHLGRIDEAQRLRTEADVLARYVGG